MTLDKSHLETALMNMIAGSEIIEDANERITDFDIKANEIFYEATKGKLHAVLIGNDVGSQRGLILSPELIRKSVILDLFEAVLKYRLLSKQYWYLFCVINI
jgi:hypothetical protein